MRIQNLFAPSPPEFVVPTGAKGNGGSCFSRLRAALYMLLVAAIVVFGAHAADTAASARFNKISHRLMCTCGCTQTLGECNHMGCPNLDQESSLLAASIQRGDSDDQIFHAFQDQYGPIALAAPMFTRLNRFSWWVPPIVLLLGLGVVFFVVRRWRPRTVSMPAPASDPNMLVLEQQIRRETGGDL
jgi:cytochrome c-type biogenesis protein CcmH/NrfF